MANAISERGGETTRLGSFEIVRRLARGGMAEIFLARTSGPSGFEKLVVLKKILPKYAGKSRFVELFLDEARLAASLDHPHIAQVYDIGIADGSYFFTMEYLHGQDVRSILHRTWRTGELFPIEHAVQIARHVASALHFAHEKQGPDGVSLGIVHRDVSPSNIIVTYDGATKLLDFGVAKTTARSVKTRTGALKGKISYMSPEQARGIVIDRRSDIFSLGIVLWEMVTTQRLYRGENDLATLQLIITRPPRPPSAVRPDVPPELERIVLRALAQDRDDRYATAEQLLTELDELAREHKLKQTSNALSSTVSQLFAAELGAWREARAAGVPLAEHLYEAGDLTTPVSESDFIEVDAGLDEDDDDEPDDEAASSIGDGPASSIGDRPTAIGKRPTSRGGPPTASGEPATSIDGAPAPADGVEPVHGLGDDELTEHVAMVLDVGDPPPSDPTEPITPPDAVTALLPSVDPRSALPPTPSPVPPGPAFSAIAATPVPSAPFAAPPWQSGQPASPAPPPAQGSAADDRVHRSWAIIDLPAFDPEAFARHRRIVLRVTAGVVGFILLLAIIAGRC